MPTGTLPASGKKTWEEVYSKSLKSSCKGDKQCAAQSAWSAVKGAGWRKKNGKWTKKSELVETFSMYISKASYDGKVMRWQAVNSDTDPDSREERMSLELYQDFIHRVVNKMDVPDIFKSAICSDYWQGGMPYLSISHYPDLNGKAVPGEVLELFIDGNKLKAKGALSKTPLGVATYRSLKEDKNKQPDEKIRISIGFLDLAHKHGENGKVWVRDNLTSVCPECFDGVGDKVYVRGYLVHLAMTRVPVNKRTEMVLEEKSEMSKKIPTRKEDAATIVGDALAEQIDATNQASVAKSDVLVEMSEEPTEEETQELIAKAEDVGVEVPASETEKSEAAPETPVVASTTDPRGYKEVEPKSEPAVEESMDTGYSLPYGGATSMKEAQKAQEAVEEMSHVYGLFAMFQNVAWNIIDRDDVPDKKAAFSKAVDEFKSMLAAKAMVEFSQTQPVVVNNSVAVVDHPLKPALDAILSAVDNSVIFEGDLNSKLQIVNPTLQELGQAITDYVMSKSAANESAAPDDNNKNLLNNIKELIQPLADSMKVLGERVAIVEAKSSVQSVQPKSRIPAPRTAIVSPALPNLTKKAETSPTPKLHSIISKSVGLPDNSSG